jgi:prepilin-type N-terminal cleavage/methylation domain-containing protein
MTKSESNPGDEIRNTRAAAVRLRPLEFGRHSSFVTRHSSLSGFTLIELVVVMTLLVVSISIAWPALSNFFRGRTLDSEARRLLALTRQGQSRAVSEGVPMVLWVDPARRSYGLEEDSSYTVNDPKATEFSLDSNLQIEVVNGNTLNSAPVRSHASGNHMNVPQIRFEPDGTVADASVQSVRLLDRTGISFWLTQSRNRQSYEIRNQGN